MSQEDWEEIEGKHASETTTCHTGDRELSEHHALYAIRCSSFVPYGSTYLKWTPHRSFGVFLGNKGDTPQHAKETEDQEGIWANIQHDVPCLGTYSGTLCKDRERKIRNESYGLSNVFLPSDIPGETMPTYVLHIH